ncbi:SirB2 family protein [Pelomonas sp. SE-A7]|uniref:SirB2 family protein n=1 Tax=Pelomonas sp. SE-A7 TaxID=3054953 RepID=UPI00259CAC32|nr:SirB2 family protein [Pelomonas sp. SE-A7]MDM4767316.1 SirB2 family protein [Pelomonas sp. SE-A7]
MIEHYPTIKLVHLALVATSGSLFAARGLGVLTGAAWPMQELARRASVLIDSALLLAGATLWMQLQLNPLGNAPWLGVKLLLLLVYIALGSVALKRGSTASRRRLAYAAALAVFGFMLTVARAHHPLGLLAAWSG